MMEKMMMKTPEELENQLTSLEKNLGKNIAPSHSHSREDVLNISEDELKEKFPKRYEIYLDLLRKKRRQEETENFQPQDLIEANKWLSILNSLDDYIVLYEQEISDDPRHPTQKEVFGTLRDFLEQGKLSGYVKLPTGTGKTEVFKRFVEAMNQRSLIVVPNNVLVDQTEEKMVDSTIKDDIGIINKKNKDYDAGTIIITYASLIRNINNGSLNPDDFPVLILDEAHKALGGEASEVIKKFEKSIRIGFTATPDYTEEKTLLKLLSEIIFQMNIDEAVRAGMLSHVQTLVIKTNVSLSSVGIKRGEYIESEAAKKLNHQGRNQLALQYYQEKFAGQQAVAYCIGVEHAKAMTELFKQSGIKAEVISGQNTKKERDGILERFEKGETTILCNADILIEGFDNDNVSVCLNLRPTMSAVVAEQRGGRVIRLNKNNPDKIGYIVDFLDDDDLAAGLLRPSPILYREILGATAIARAKHSKSSKKAESGDNKKDGDGEKDDIFSKDLNSKILGIEVVGNEVGYAGLLQRKEEYKEMKKEQQRQKEREGEIKEARKELENKLSHIGSHINTIKQVFDNEKINMFSSTEVGGFNKILKEVDELENEYLFLCYDLRQTPSSGIKNFKPPLFDAENKRANKIIGRLPLLLEKFQYIYKGMSIRKRMQDNLDKLIDWRSVGSIYKILNSKSINKDDIRSVATKIINEGKYDSVFMVSADGQLYEAYQPELSSEIIKRIKESGFKK